MREKILQDIFKSLKEKGFEPTEGEINETTSFTEDLGMDSLDQIEMIMELEKVFNISIPDDQAEEMKVVGDIANYVEAKIGRQVV